jgi:DNA processing protein
MEDIYRVQEIPESLKSLKNPPKELFYQGDLGLLTLPKVAIIGTRRPNQYSRQTTYQLANMLSKIGVAVVSGGALGTDITAHRGAFPKTISIMANSLDYIYPKTNSETIVEMSKSSLLLSESERGVPAHSKRFIHRNRLIVGLSEIVVVAEADINSGSSYTMDMARRLGKEIYVLPHRINDSLATNLYLSKGYAKAIYNLDEFIGSVKERFDLNSVEEQKSSDEIIEFCLTNPTYEDAFQRFGDRLFERELDGDIEIVNGIVVVI